MGSYPGINSAMISLPAIDRLPYFPETAAAVLQEAPAVVVAGAGA